MIKLGLYQLAPIILFVIGLSRMARFDNFEPLKTGGVLWFQDLTAADPRYIFPILSIATTVLLFEWSPTPNRNKDVMRVIAIALALVSYFVTVSFPTVRDHVLK